MVMIVMMIVMMVVVIMRNVKGTESDENATFIDINRPSVHLNQENSYEKLWAMVVCVSVCVCQVQLKYKHVIV